MLTTLILNLLTSKVVPVILPPVVTWGRKVIREKVPPQFIPLALTLGGGVVTMAAEAIGAEVPPDLPQLGAAAWDGALLGLATTGVHQLVKQGREWYRELKARRKAKQLSE